MYRNRMIDYIAAAEKGSELGIGGEKYVLEGVRTNRVMEYLCMEEGTDLKGAFRCGKHYLGNVYKVPVRLANSDLFFFPVNGTSREDAVWICSGQVSRLRKGTNGCTEIEFEDGLKLSVPVGARSVRERIKLCRKYSHLLDNSAFISELIQEKGDRLWREKASKEKTFSGQKPEK